MTRLQVIKCSPNLYKGVSIKFNRNMSKVFVYTINPKLFIKRDQLLIVQNKGANSVQIVNKVDPTKTINISLALYGVVNIQFMSTNQPKNNRLLMWMVNSLNTFTINMQSFVGTLKSSNKFANSTSSKVIEKSLIKPYWSKKSDSVRSTFIRLWRYNELTGMYTDAKLSRSFSNKFAVVKYLSWKLGMSINELNQFTVKGLLSDNLCCSVINILVLSGYYANYTSAKTAILKGKVCVNNSIVTDVWQLVKIKDLIQISPTEWSNLLPVNLNKFMSIMKGGVFIKQLPNANDLLVSLLTQSIKSNHFSNKLLDPLNTVFVRGNSWVNRIRN